MSHMLTDKAVLTLDWAERILALCGKRLAVRSVTIHRDTPQEES